MFDNIYVPERVALTDNAISDAYETSIVDSTANPDLERCDGLCRRGAEDLFQEGKLFDEVKAFLQEKDPERAMSLLVRIPKKDGDFRDIEMPPILAQIASEVYRKHLVRKVILPRAFYAQGVVHEHQRDQLGTCPAIWETMRLSQHRAMLSIDIKNFYGALRHDKIREALKPHLHPEDIEQCLWLVTLTCLNRETGEITTRRNGKGISQGNPLSPLLAHMVIAPVAKRIPECVTYVDDWIIPLSTIEESYKNILLQSFRTRVIRRTFELSKRLRSYLPRIANSAQIRLARAWQEQYAQEVFNHIVAAFQEVGLQLGEKSVEDALYDSQQDFKYLGVFVRTLAEDVQKRLHMEHSEANLDEGNPQVQAKRLTAQCEQRGEPSAWSDSKLPSWAKLSEERKKEFRQLVQAYQQSDGFKDSKQQICSAGYSSLLEDSGSKYQAYPSLSIRRDYKEDNRCLEISEKSLQASPCRLRGVVPEDHPSSSLLLSGDVSKILSKLNQPHHQYGFNRHLYVDFSQDQHTRDKKLYITSTDRCRWFPETELYMALSLQFHVTRPSSLKARAKQYESLINQAAKNVAAQGFLIAFIHLKDPENAFYANKACALTCPKGFERILPGKVHPLPSEYKVHIWRCKAKRRGRHEFPCDVRVRKEHRDGFCITSPYFSRTYQSSQNIWMQGFKPRPLSAAFDELSCALQAIPGTHRNLIVYHPTELPTKLLGPHEARRSYLIEPVRNLKKVLERFDSVTFIPFSRKSRPRWNKAYVHHYKAQRSGRERCPLVKHSNVGSTNTIAATITASWRSTIEQ